MTALCGGGASGPQFGAAAITDVGASALAVAFEDSGCPYLIPAIPLLSLAPLVLSTFCSTDPPAQPTFTANEINALQNLTLGADFTSGLGKCVTLAQNLLWYRLCQCTSVPTPVVPTPPAPPAGTQIPLQLQTGQLALCSSFGGPISIGTSATLETLGQAFGTHTCSFGGETLRANLQTIKLTCVRTAVGAGPHDTTTAIRLQWGSTCVNPTQTNLGSVPPDGLPHVFQFTYNPAYQIETFNFSQPNVSTDTLTVFPELFCGSPGATGIGCCPPDTLTLSLLKNILDQVNTLQRFGVPFGYVLGTPSAGLTGTGSVPGSRAIGVAVNVTAFPGSNEQLPGNPAYVKDLGWLSVGDADGMIEERRVSQLAFAWFPRLMPVATGINYEFFPGVTATITPLLAEAAP